MSNNEIFDFLQEFTFFKFLLIMGVPWQTRKYIRGSTITKQLKSTELDYSWDLSYAWAMQ